MTQNKNEDHQVNRHELYSQDKVRIESEERKKQLDKLKESLLVLMSMNTIVMTNEGKLEFLDKKHHYSL